MFIVVPGMCVCACVRACVCVRPHTRVVQSVRRSRYFSIKFKISFFIFVQCKPLSVE